MMARSPGGVSPHRDRGIKLRNGHRSADSASPPQSVITRRNIRVDFRTPSGSVNRAHFRNKTRRAQSRSNRKNTWGLRVAGGASSPFPYLVQGVRRSSSPAWPSAHQRRRVSSAIRKPRWVRHAQKYRISPKAGKHATDDFADRPESLYGSIILPLSSRASN